MFYCMFYFTCDRSLSTQLTSVCAARWHCSVTEESREVKVDRTQATEFGNRLKQVEQRLNSLHTSVMQDQIMIPRLDEQRRHDRSDEVITNV